MKRGKEKELLCLDNYVVCNVVLSQLSSLLEQWTDSAIMAIFATPGANISSKKKISFTIKNAKILYRLPLAMR